MSYRANVFIPFIISLYLLSSTPVFAESLICLGENVWIKGAVNTKFVVNNDGTLDTIHQVGTVKISGTNRWGQRFGPLLGTLCGEITGQLALIAGVRHDIYIDGTGDGDCLDYTENGFEGDQLHTKGDIGISLLSFDPCALFANEILTSLDHNLPNSLNGKHVSDVSIFATGTLLNVITTDDIDDACYRQDQPDNSFIIVGSACHYQ